MPDGILTRICYDVAVDIQLGVLSFLLSPVASSASSRS